MAEEDYIITALSQEIDPYKLSSIDVNKKSAADYYSPAFIEKTVKRSTKVLDTLDPEQVWRFVFLYQKAFENGLLPLYYEGYRTFDRSDELYREYKKTGEVLAAPPGSSYHNYRLAVDALVYDREGNGNMPGGLEKLNELNKQWGLGLTWGGAWGDGPHFEFSEKGVKQLQDESPEWQDYLATHQGAQVAQEEKELVESWKEEKQTRTWWQANRGWAFPGLLITLAIGIIALSVFAFREN